MLFRSVSHFLLELFPPPIFSELESLEKQQPWAGGLGCTTRTTLCYKDRVNQLLIGLSGTDEGKDTASNIQETLPARL